MKDRYRYPLVILLSIAVLISCSPFDPVPDPDAPGELPDTYSLYSGESDASSPWWERI
jgi:hypothetical protein